jgi:tetratricopeptide (TPR) repeat protein
LKKHVLYGFIAVLSAISVSAHAQVAALIEEADRAFDPTDRPFSLPDYEADLRLAITLYERALPLLADAAVQSRSHVLARLAEAHFDLATAYLADRGEQEAAYGKGKDYALVGLRLDPDFGRVEKESGFRAALRSADDVAMIFWYGNTLGRYIEFHPLTAISGGMEDVRASFTRAIELDPAYMAGAPLRSLGSFLAQVPSFLGGNLDEAAADLEQAIALGPEYLENYVNCAEYVAKSRGDWLLFCGQLRRALELSQDPSVMAEWPLYNALALVRAETLVQWTVGGQRVCGP